MKFIINQKALIAILEKGCIAALSDSAQEELSAMAPLFKSVKIDLKGQKLVVSSASRLLYTEYSYTLQNEDGAENKEDGVILAPAKELLDWIRKQPESKIAISFEPDKTATSETVVKGRKKETAIITKLGTVKIVSRDISKTGSKWSFDCYDHNQITWVNYPEEGKIFSVPLEQLKTALPYVSISNMATHDLHIYDGIIFQNSDEKLYMYATDKTRFSFYEMSKCIDLQMNNAVIVPQKVLSTLIKQLDITQNVEFLNSDKLKKVIIKQSNFIAGIVMPDQSIINQYILPVKMLKEVKHIELARVPKTMLKSRLETSVMVNNGSLLFYFSENPMQLILHAIPDNGKSPNTCNTLVKSLSKTVKYLWNPRHILDFVKVIQDEDVIFNYPENGGNISIVSAMEPLFVYYIKNKKIEKTAYDKAIL